MRISVACSALLREDNPGGCITPEPSLAADLADGG
jgi:hypothetical protein